MRHRIDSTRGAWMQSYTGRAFYPTSPSPGDWSLADIAHALSLQNRFAGHTLWPYSVAEHCVRGSYLVAPEHALPMLLHDGSETYGIDLPRPIKGYLPEYKAIERRLARTMESWAGLPPWSTETAALKRADWAMLATEARDLMAPPPAPWSFPPGTRPADWRMSLWTPRGLVEWLASLPLHVAHEGGFLSGAQAAGREFLASGPWPWWLAERRFIARFEELTRDRAQHDPWTHTHHCPRCCENVPCTSHACETGDEDDGTITGDPRPCATCEGAGAQP